MAKLTGSQIIARTLKNYGVEFVAGIPGHGAWVLMDALLDEESKIPFVQVYHEQSAVHLADGYYRASGKPMVAMTSIGPGAANTIIGLATAFNDSTSVLLITGGPLTHMRGHGVMQALDRKQDNAFPRITEQVTKRQWEVTHAAELPFVLHRAFSAMMTGRPGPVHIEVPMDVQAELVDVDLHDLEKRIPIGRSYPDPGAVAAAVELLKQAQRPVILVGGGAISGEAGPEVLALAEALSAPVITTWNGKSAFPEDHDLFAGSIGQTGTIPGNTIGSTADVVISIGCRFTDWTASSYRSGASLSIPPGKLIHIDLDPHEIGKNYETEVGIAADVKPTVAAIVGALDGYTPTDRGAYLAELAELKASWESQLAARRESDASPMTSQRPLGELRKLLPRDGFIIVGSGNGQGTVKQTFPVYIPRTHIGSGSYSPMGWALPAAIGVKLAQPDRAVVCVIGDGDFLMTLQEIAVCVARNIAVIFVVQNNAGYMSIRGGQRKITDRHIGSEFSRPDGSAYTPDFVEVAKAFGLKTWRADTGEEFASAVKLALETDGPTLIEATTARDAAGPFVPGWWDLPIPGNITDARQVEYHQGRAEEQHL
jgi:acetolactate synthase-1/2/3 large subunit